MIAQCILCGGKAQKRSAVCAWCSAKLWVARVWVRKPEFAARRAAWHAKRTLTNPGRVSRAWKEISTAEKAKAFLRLPAEVVSIDITNAEHREALAWACALKLGAELPSVADGTSALRAGCCKALSDPTKAADLIRQLVEKAGQEAQTFRSHGHYDCCSPLPTFAFYPGCAGLEVSVAVSINGTESGFDLMTERHVPDAVARLLSLPPNAGAEAVLQALRGE